MDAAIGVGLVIIGAILLMLEFRNMYMTMVVIVVVMIVAYYFVHGKHAKVHTK